jgi:hypothetical protein
MTHEISTLLSYMVTTKKKIFCELQIRSIFSVIAVVQVEEIAIFSYLSLFRLKITICKSKAPRHTRTYEAKKHEHILPSYRF